MAFRVGSGEGPRVLRSDFSRRHVRSSRSRSLASVRRGRRHPAGAHAVAVAAARRLRSGARFGVAPANSLRSLRSLRSDSAGEMVDEARCARRPRPSAPRRHKNRPRRVPPAAKPNGGGDPERLNRHGGSAKAWPGRVQRFVWSVEERRAFGRARSALRRLTRFHCLSAVSEANAASSETGRMTEHRRAVVAQRRPRSRRRCARPGRAFAATTPTLTRRPVTPPASASASAPSP